jgi:hypothetical protein
VAAVGAPDTVLLLGSGEFVGLIMSGKNLKLFRQYLIYARKQNPNVKLKHMIELWTGLSDQERKQWRKDMRRRGKMEYNKRLMESDDEDCS